MSGLCLPRCICALGAYRRQTIRKNTLVKVPSSTEQYNSTEMTFYIFIHVIFTVGKPWLFCHPRSPRSIGPTVRPFVIISAIMNKYPPPATDQVQKLCKRRCCNTSDLCLLVAFFLHRSYWSRRRVVATDKEALPTTGFRCSPIIYRWLERCVATMTLTEVPIKDFLGSIHVRHQAPSSEFYVWFSHFTRWGTKGTLHKNGKSTG